MSTVYFSVLPLPNPTLLRVYASWVHGASPTWAGVHWTTVPREYWPEGWLPPEEFRWQRPDYFPEVVNPFTNGSR